MKTVGFALLAILFLIAGCRTINGPVRATAESPKTADEGAVFEFTGTVVFVPLEGGFYGILGDDGGHYDPLNLPESLCKDGMKVQVKASVLKHGASFHMWGKRIKILEIKSLQ
jgi:hypothetical protein